MSSVLMNGWSVGKVVGFLAGYRCFYCWRGDRLGGGLTGGPVGGSFGVDTFLILYCCIL